MRSDFFRLFSYRLARTLGMTRAELMNRISDRELWEQIAYNRIEPLPDPWLQTGIVAALLYNTTQKGPRKTPADWIPCKPAPMKDQDPAEISSIFQALAQAMTAGAQNGAGHPLQAPAPPAPGPPAPDQDPPAWPP